jgi:hypothetical protein
MKDIGENESNRLVEISDTDAKNLDEAFRNMWVIASSTRVKKPLHHISINPFKGERLTDAEVMKIIESCEEKYGYKRDDHQRVVVEHVKDGRQHFHVIWNRVSLTTNRAVWPGMHWNKSKQTAREMEKELGLKRPVTRRSMRMATSAGTRTGGKRPFPPTGHSGGFGAALINPPVLSSPKRVTRGRPSSENASAPFRPQPTTNGKKGWPEAAILDWEDWGKRDPVRFFTLWAELAPAGFAPP